MSVHIEEHAGMRMPEKKDTSKGSQERETGSDWMEKVRRDGLDRSKDHTDRATSSKESVFGDPRSEQKDKGNPWRRDEESRTGGGNRPTTPGRNAEACHVPGGMWLSQVRDCLQD
ncbi:hypothetical protein NDU88_008104 [Pleurodeles waltl]|uniref:Uncharacterized protein n=1 Tax=Pleurodeles waltl TaxID=8319 RepID=A0AAV7RVX9_PLEWA|nr:hypothetical protein NDU88_008104 [Pleurodeles waltl]